MIKTVLDVLLLLLAFFLPFEIIHPLLILPWFEFTNLELLVIASVTVWFIHTLRRYAPATRSRAAWARAASQGVELGRHSLIWLPVLFLALSVLSSVMAPAHRLDALKFVTRIGMGLAVFWILIDHVRSRAYLVLLLWALVTGAGISALVGLGEAVAWPPLVPLLELFKEAPTRVGGELRVSATFQYATMAAMFFEVCIPLAMALAATARTAWHRWPALAVVLLGTANIVLAFSRAGMITLAIFTVAMLALAWRRPHFRQLAPPALFAIGILVALTGALAWQTETFRTRLLTENDLSWYGASYIAPPSLRLMTGEPTTVTVSVQNTGTVRWHATGENPFALGYYWLTSDQQAVQEDHVELPLPQAVSPGEIVHVTAVLNPPLPPGDYQLVWGMLQHHILWFRHRSVPEAYTTVHIQKGSGIAATPPETTAAIPGGGTPTVPPTVGRLALWRAAVRMWVERPLLGVGPDNFRHLYGHYLNLSEWDSRLHANNFYLELLAGWGIGGTLVFAALMWVIARRWFSLWRMATGAAAIWSLALGASFLAFFVHGFLDYFLEFVPLYLLFWTVAGLIVATERMAVNVENGILSWVDDLPSTPPAVSGD